MDICHEHQQADVVICGAGPAGFAAAVTAARAKASTVLSEALSAPGGTWTMSFLSSASDWRTKTPLMQELEKRL